MRQLEPKRVTIGEVEYAIYPFGAFDAAAISGDLAKIIGPLLVGVLPLLDATDDSEWNELVPPLTSVLTTLDGDKLQNLLRQLLIVKKNISCEYRNEDGQIEQKNLTIEVANELFVGNLDAMIELAVEVVKFNFGGFFTQMRTLFGNRKKNTGAKTRKSSGRSTQDDLVTLS